MVNGRISFNCPLDNREKSQLAPRVDSSLEDMTGEPEEPPEQLHKSFLATKTPKSQFTRSTYGAQKQSSLLTRIFHTSESDSHVDEDDYAFYEPNRALSSASTYSRSSAVSMTEHTSGHTSPRTDSPSPRLSATSRFSGLYMFKQNLFSEPSKIKNQHVETVAPTQNDVKQAEPLVEAGLGRKRCIKFACGGDAKPVSKPAPPAKVEVTSAPASRKCSLKFVCPTRDGTLPRTVSRTRLASPPPPGHHAHSTPKVPRPHRGSDSTVRHSSPKMARKFAATVSGRRRGSVASDMSRTEATRFHEFANSSGEEDDDWTKESTCYSRRLTVEDTLAVENGLRKLGREVEEEEAEEDADEEDDVVDEDQVEEDEDDEEEGEDDEDDLDVQSAGSYDSDEGFQTDDEEGFAHSEDDSDEGSEYDWWTPGRHNASNNIDHIRPFLPRVNSASSIESQAETPGPGRRLRRQGSRPIEIEQTPDLPDSTDFVCGTLDEDKPLERAYFNHLQQRRAAKHKAVPQDIDPTFPESDFEIDDEEDENSEHVASESDHPMVFGGPHLEPERKSRRNLTSKRSPLPSPRRLKSPAPQSRRARSPAPTKRISVRSPLPPLAVGRRPRSPAPFVLGRTRLSTSMPRRKAHIRTRPQPLENNFAEDDNDQTPRFNRRAIDIVMGLEKKRARRREKMYKEHCRKSGKPGNKKLQPGKGAEKMRDVGIGLNEYRKGKSIAINKKTEPSQSPVHMMSY